MTANQIAYWRLKEEERSNLAKEAETHRSNVVSEAETQRANRAREDYERMKALASAETAKAKTEETAYKKGFGISDQVRDWMFSIFPTGGEAAKALTSIFS